MKLEDLQAMFDLDGTDLAIDVPLADYYDKTTVDGLDLSLVNDLSPQLGGDLDLNGFNIEGTLENVDFVLDGGLL